MSSRHKNKNVEDAFLATISLMVLCDKELATSQCYTIHNLWGNLFVLSLTILWLFLLLNVRWSLLGKPTMVPLNPWFVLCTNHISLWHFLKRFATMSAQTQECQSTGSDLVRAFNWAAPSHSFVRRASLRPMALRLYPAFSKMAMLCGTTLFLDVKVGNRRAASDCIHLYCMCGEKSWQQTMERNMSL